MPGHFPHIELQFVTQGDVNSGPIPRFERRQERSLDNLNNRAGHGQALKSLASGVAARQQQQLNERQQAGQPSLPPAVSFFLETNSAAWLDAR
jgi:hypothetical protein